MIWGDYPPAFESEKEYEQVFSLVMRHWNGIAANLMQQPADFEPMFYEREVDGRMYAIVDEWCEAYMRGIELALVRGASLDSEVKDLLYPIRAFTEVAEWPGHDLPNFAETEKFQQQIAPNVRALHAYWFERREDPIPAESTPVRLQAACRSQRPLPLRQRQEVQEVLSSLNGKIMEIIWVRAKTIESHLISM